MIFNTKDFNSKIQTNEQIILLNKIIKPYGSLLNKYLRCSHVVYFIEYIYIRDPNQISM